MFFQYAQPDLAMIARSHWDEALIFFKIYKLEGTILVKVSRGMKIERCVEVLMKQREVTL